MSIRYRPMEPEDIFTCAAIIARHPVYAPRYGETIAHLGATWQKLLVTDGFISTVFEEVRGAKSTVIGAGIAVFVTDDFVHDLKTSPHFWIGPELVNRILRGKSPVLSDKELREANSSGGLNIATWQCGVSPEDLARGDVGNTIMAAFVKLISGYRVKEEVLQGESVEHMQAALAAGAFLWSADKGSYENLDGVPSKKLLKERHILGMSRDLASRFPGSWAASTYLYNPPRFTFSRSEQRLLLCGLDGGTDEEIARKLSISLAAVRKTWRMIYERVGTIAPDLALNQTQGNGRTAERGKEKKQRVLACVREHPEELRPISRKLLREAIAHGSDSGGEHNQAQYGR
jgi:hypothetical protein